MSEEHDNFMVKVNDAEDKPIIYDKALEDFQLINNFLKKLVCFFLENNLIDYCFDAVDSKDISLQDNRGFVQNHLKLNISESPKGVNIEYVIHKVYKFEAEY